MVANYYTLRHIALQLNQQLKGWLVREIFSQNKNELILSLESPPGRSGGLNRKFLTVSCEPSQNFLFLAESFARAKRNSIDFFPQIVGQPIRSISMLGADRQIAVEMESGIRLVIRFFGSKANVLLVQQDDSVLSSFLRSKDTVGETMIQRQNRDSVLNQDNFSNQLRELGEISVAVALKRFFPRFGGLLLTELLHRAGIARSETIDRLSDEEIDRLFRAGESVTKELEAACAPRIYYEGTNAIEFSIIELHHCRQYEKKEFNSISDAIREYLGATKSLDRFAREKARIEQGLSKELERIERTLTKISVESESVDRAAHYELMGELLKAHLHELQKGMAEAVVENTLDGTNELTTVPLDKNLTPAKNADRYFEKAKKSRIAAAEKQKQRGKLAQERSARSTMLRKLNAIVTGDEFSAFLDEHRDGLQSLGLVKAAHAGRAAEQEVPFRVFRVAGDFIVWAGKSGENNDLLSTRYTKSKDLWFHARSVGGSHVVLKFGSGKGEISKQAIDEAAAIAAYYSKMKNSKLVPVSVCEGKYVRKPKGAPPGTVTIEREKVVFVEPRLPTHQ